MSKLKILIAALILAFSLTGAYLVISHKEKSIIPPITIEENNPVGIEPISGSKINLTELLIKNLGEGIAKENIEGFNVVKGEPYIAAPSPEKATQDLIDEAEKNFDPNSLRPTIPDSSLKISEDNSKKALIAYFNSFTEIIIASAKKVPASFLLSSGDLKSSDFTQIVNIYSETIINFYDLSAPRLVLDIHRKEIELLATKKNIYEKIANAEEDPATALLANTMLLKIDGEFATLNTETKNFIEKYSLNK